MLFSKLLISFDVCKREYFVYGICFKNDGETSYISKEKTTTLTHYEYRQSEDVKMLSAKISQVASMLQSKEVSSLELCKLCLNRVTATKELNHFISLKPQLTEELAKDAEKAFTQKQSKGISQLNGIPIAVKDNFCTETVPTSCGSKMLHGYISPYTATVVRKLLNRGAVLLGKTNLDEFAMGCGTVDSYYGPTRNPWKYRHKNDTSKTITSLGSDTYIAKTIEDKMIDDKDWYIAGGSSGGSAVAVATGSVFGALGSDTGGSTRNPAALCGVVGLKPTYGRLSRHGLIPLVNSMDVPGILTRTVDDSALMLNALSGRDPFDSTTVDMQYDEIHLPDQVSVKDLHIGIPKEYYAPGLSEETAVWWQRVADMFSDAGARVSQVSLPHTQLSIVCYHILNTCEVASNMARYDGIEYGHRAGDDSSTEALYAQTRHEALNDVVRSRILAGNYFLLRENYNKYFIQALKIRRLIADDFYKIYSQGIDLLLTPTVLGDAPHYDWFSKADNRTRTQEQDLFTQPVNMAGVPAITVPTALSSNKLPIGLQLIGQMFKEKTLLTAAKWMEEQLKFPHLNLSSLLQETS